MNLPVTVFSLISGISLDRLIDAIPRPLSGQRLRVV